MKTLIEILFFFTIIWILWYITGGPLRNSDNPYITNEQIPVKELQIKATP